MFCGVRQGRLGLLSKLVLTTSSRRFHCKTRTASLEHWNVQSAGICTQSSRHLDPRQDHPALTELRGKAPDTFRVAVARLGTVSSFLRQSTASDRLHRPLRLTTIGHAMEIGFGKRKNVKSKMRPPLVPQHPNDQSRPDMNLMVTYRDLLMRWRRDKRKYYRTSEKKLHIKRRRRLRFSGLPEPMPTCVFVLHSQMPYRKKPTELPPIRQLNTDDSFAIIKVNVEKQHKVTRGDLVMMKRLHRRQAGDKVVFGTVLMVGSRDWTIIGRPTVPYARVLGTIEQQTITKDEVSFHYGKRFRGRFHRYRRYVSIVHIDKILVDPNMQPQISPPRAIRLIDIWANRWLDPDELAGVKYKKDGITPVVEDIYDGREMKPGLYQRLGLTDCYRFDPDPLNACEAFFLQRRYEQDTA